MTEHVQFAVFTLFPLLLLVSATVVSLLKIRQIGEYRLLLLVGILALMGQHQLLEAGGFLFGGAVVGGYSEAIETGANVFSSVAVYYGLVFAERQQTLAKDLRVSEQRYRTLTEQSPMPIMVHREGEILYANLATADMFRAGDPAELVGRPVSDLLPPGEAEAFQAHIDALLDDEGRVRTAEQRWVGLEGTDREVVVSGACAPYRGEQAVHVMFRDLTREREIERNLQQVKSQFETTLESSNDAIILIDPAADEIRRANRRAVDLLGYDRDELVGMSPTEIHPHELSSFREFVDTVQAETSLLTDELSCRTCDGEEIPVEISAALIEDGESEFILAAIRDISERKRREHQIDVLRRILRHNLRNEMSVIMGYADSLAERSEDPTLVSAAEKIETRAKELAALSTSVRKLQDVVEGSDKRDTVAVAPLVADIVDTYRAEYPAATIETDVPESLQVRSAGGLHWAVENLVDNAVVHTDTDPWVRIVARQTSGQSTPPHVEITVTDDGPGIPEGELAAVDISTEQTAIKHGSGFGLHAVSQIATLSGGEFDLGDRPDSDGTVATLTLPTPGPPEHPQSELTTATEHS
jgi:PAS domain S-box-containing protein